MSYKSRRANHARAFNSLMCYPNNLWAADVLEMELNPHKGPDLIDSENPERISEVKFKLQLPSTYMHKSWRVLGHQIDYGKDKPYAFWTLGFYTMDKPVGEISKRDSQDLDLLESLVKSREIYLVHWDWMSRFKFYHHNGKTEKSEWDHDIAFPKFANLPTTIQTIEVKKGLVHITEGLSEEAIPNRLKQLV